MSCLRLRRGRGRRLEKARPVVSEATLDWVLVRELESGTSSPFVTRKQLQAIGYFDAFLPRLMGALWASTDRAPGWRSAVLLDAWLSPQ